MTEQPRSTASQLVDRLRALLDEPARALVAVDYDGTLAPIVDDPARAVPSPGAVEALTALAPRVGRLAVVTGRPVREALRVGGLEAVPGLVVLGLYGAQRWAGDRVQQAPVPRGLVAAREAVRRLLEDPPSPVVVGTTLEDKGASFAVHTRRAVDPGAALRVLRDPLARLATTHGLRLEPGRLVLELRGFGFDKGVAVRTLATTEPPCRSVLYAGDDLGDLAAFEAVRALADQGVAGWTVAAASREAPRVADAADLVVDGPAGVVELLAALAERLGADAG
jgi:trehalose 6-phosphate phosphatase